MRIVDATWEKRNLFLETKEIHVEEGDTLEQLDAALKEATEEYVVVRLPMCHTEKEFLLTEYGYTHIEVMATWQIKDLQASLPPLSEAKQKLYEKTELKEATSEEKKAALTWISGSMFNTDRIALDPYFSQELSGRRYLGWISDEFSRGGGLWQLMLDGKAVGFLAFAKHGADAGNCFLSGIYPPYQGKGLAFLRSYKGVDLMISKGCTHSFADISTNNYKPFRDQISAGSDLAQFTHTYVKHNLPREEYWKRLEPHKDTLISEALSWIK